MGILSGPITFSRFLVVGKTPSNLTAFMGEQLRRFAFREPNAADAQEKILGWTGIESALDTDFRRVTYAWGGYLLFSLRIDRRMLSPTLIKLRSLEAEQRYLQETGRKKVDKIAREQIRDSVRRDLMDLTIPTPSFFEICWSVSDGRLLFTSLSEKVMQDFQDLFNASFGLVPCPFAPCDPEAMKGEMADRVAALQKTVLRECDSRSLGREFLTWLWFKSEERNGMIRVPGVGETEIHLVRRIVLESGDGEYSESVVCQGLHADLREGREALRRGKKIKEARLLLTRDAATWEFTFKADRFQFQSMKMPVVMDMTEEQGDQDGRVLERLYLVEAVVQTMDRLFAWFLSLRMPENWQQENARIEKWLRSSSD